MRREFLDQVPFWNARDLEWKLAEFQVYTMRHAAMRDEFETERLQKSWRNSGGGGKIGLNSRFS
jgi:hypothetical protein